MIVTVAHPQCAGLGCKKTALMYTEIIPTTVFAKKNKYIYKKSETRLTANALKQNPNIWKVEKNADCNKLTLNLHGCSG